MISDESFQSGIRYCIHHQSDPYVENICEPQILKTNLHKTIAESGEELGLIEHKFNKSTSKPSNTYNNYEWDKYNSDFNHLC